METKFFIRGDTSAPKRLAGHDAGFDVYVPNLTEKFMADLGEKNPGHPFRWGLVGAPEENKENESVSGMYIYLAPGQDLLIPTYVEALIPNDEVLLMRNKSGVCTKQKFMVGADTIDSSYEGIIHVHIFNVSNEMRFIEFGQKIAQMIPLKINNEACEVWYDSSIEKFKEMKNQTTHENFYASHESTRGDKGFGEGTGLK